MGVLKSLLAVSAESTLLDIDSTEHSTGQPSNQTVHVGENEDKREHVEDDESQVQAFEFDVATQEASQDIDRLPEPPVSPPSSNTLMSTPSMSTSGDSPNAPIAKPELKNGRVPSANRLSISYAGGNRRLVVDAEVVESLRVYRQEGRIEVLMNISQEGDDGLKGILVCIHPENVFEARLKDLWYRLKDFQKLQGRTFHFRRHPRTTLLCHPSSRYQFLQP